MKWVTSLACVAAFVLTSAGVSTASDCCGTPECSGAAPCAAESGAEACCPSTPCCETRTVMRTEYVTETRQVPVTTYQQETRTRMREVTKCVPRVETKEETYTVQVPQQQIAHRDLHGPGLRALHRGTNLRGSSSGHDPSRTNLSGLRALHRAGRKDLHGSGTRSRRLAKTPIRFASLTPKWWKRPTRSRCRSSR